MNGRTWAVTRREFRDYRRNKMIVLTMAVLPLFFLVIPIVGALALHGDRPQAAYNAAVGQAQLLFFIVPTILPTTLAAFSVVGERDQGTLEPVLSTPVSNRELLLGKALAMTVPAVALAWTFFAIFLVVIRLWAASQVVHLVWAPEQFVSEALIVPGLAVLAIIAGMLLSVRSSDVRVAQQLSGLVMLPVFVAAALPAFRVVRPTVGLFVVAAVLLWLVDVAGLRAVARTFDRERLITRFA